MTNTKPPKLDIKKIGKAANIIIGNRFYVGVRRITLKAKLKSGINKGKKSFYDNWSVLKLSDYETALENTTPQARALQRGYSTIAIQMIYNGIYVGWRTSNDPKGKKNIPLTKWCEKYIPKAAEVNVNGKIKTFHILIPGHKFKIKNHAISQLIRVHDPKIRKSIFNGLRKEVIGNIKKYTIK